MSFQDESDESLMLRYQQGDYLAFEEIYRRHSGRVYGYLRSRLAQKSEASDLLQIIFMKVHRSRERYRPEMPFLPWLYAVSRNVLTDFLRSVQRAPLLVEVPDHLAAKEKEVSSGPTAEDGLAKLDESERQLVNMRFNDELSFDEIAAALDVTPVTARKRLSRAIQKIRSALKGETKNGAK